MAQQTGALSDLAAQVWELAGGTPEVAAARLTACGPRTVLPSVFDVTGLATASVAAAALGAAEFHAVRTAAPVPEVHVDSRAASAAFAAEALFAPVGWSLPELWDPVAGNYRARDGWIRLHTNYAYHRAAVTRLLGADDRASLQAAVSRWQAVDLEAAVVAGRPLPAGTDAAGVAVRADRTVGQGRPYAGVRVLDLTRVIAGPVCTKFLAAYGADVLRLDPPGFAEVPALLPETTAGKRTAAVDITTTAGRATFERLVTSADVLVTGLRADALDKLGYDDAALTVLNPGLIIASLNAYGWDGPWRDRRGFDSLVQMSCGIAAAGGAAAGSDAPVPLPVQALDHATGYLLAAAVGRALTARLARAVASRIRASLIGTANLLWSLPRPADPAGLPPRPEEITLVGTRTAWGQARRVPHPGQIAGVASALGIEAGPLGRHQPTWLAGAPSWRPVVSNRPSALAAGMTPR